MFLCDSANRVSHTIIVLVREEPLNVQTSTILLASSPRLYAVSNWHWQASRGQQDWWPRWQLGQQPHLPSCMAPSVQLGYTHLWTCKTHEMREVGYGLE